MPPPKRPPDPADTDSISPDSKRPKIPPLTSVLVEALKEDSLTRLCSSLEPILRRIVSEEVERALAKLAPSSLAGRPSPKQIEGLDGRNLQLHFRSRLSPSIFTGGKVEGEQGAVVHVLLLDASTGHVVASGPESSAKLDIIVLDGDFDSEDGDNWSKEDFESHVVKEREGKRPLLSGDLQITLNKGVGTLGELTFTDNSSWIRSRKFRLGCKVASGFCEGTRIREAKTEAFTVKDHRGELYKKHYPPALQDEVWRLEKIGKGGSFHKRLDKAGIYVVEDFLRLVVRDPQGLRTILGSGMSNKMWEILVEHAKTCVLGAKHYVYYPDDDHNTGAVFSSIYEFSGLIFGGQYHPAERLLEHQKGLADALVKKAYANWVHVVEYDGTSLLNSNRSMVSSFDSTTYRASYDRQAPQHHLLAQLAVQQPSTTLGTINHPLDSVNCVASYDLPVPQHHLPAQLSNEQPSTATSGSVGGDMLQVHNYSTHPYHATSGDQFQFGSAPFVPQNKYIDYSHQPQIMQNSHTGLALSPPELMSNAFQPMGEFSGLMNLAGHDGWSHQNEYSNVDDLLSVEDIRMRSHEILENEDMQHLLRDFSVGGASTSSPENGCSFTSYTPTESQCSSSDGNHSRSSGKAVIGWLKIKAAMRWGIFVRKKAAARRAQLVELDD